MFQQRLDNFFKEYDLIYSDIIDINRKFALYIETGSFYEEEFDDSLSHQFDINDQFYLGFYNE